MANSAALRRLGAELRRLRDAAGLTSTEVGTRLSRSHATILNWERGKTQISRSDLVLLLAELRAPQEVRESLDQLREEARQGGGREWATYGLPSWLRSLASFETDAESIRSFETNVIPGLLQTEDYIRAVFQALPQLVAAASMDAAIEARLARQARLRHGPMRLHAAVAETALRVVVGGTSVMAAQLERLLEAAAAENVTIQVLPASEGACSAAVASFGILSFADPAVDPPLAYFDGPLGGYLVHDESDVTCLSTVFSDLIDVALDPDESIAQVSAIMDEITTKGTSDA
jgi:transcriptional regulator with XRE-family HTH domain